MADQADLATLTRDLMPETRAVFSELRVLIITTLPDSSQKLSLARKRLNFSHPNVGYFCGLSPQDGRTTLEFEYGVLLPHFGKNASRERLVGGDDEYLHYGSDAARTELVDACKCGNVTMPGE